MSVENPSAKKEAPPTPEPRRVVDGPAGLSFMLRVRNEEATLDRCMRSALDGALGWSVPGSVEMDVILHCCTDASAAVAASVAASYPSGVVRVHTYEHGVSRAGYETLATPEDSPHSLVNYCRWCLGRTRQRWVFKWDADFVLTPALNRWLAMQDADFWEAGATVGTSVKISVRNPNNDIDSCEPYLMSALHTYKKHVFWEVPLYTNAREVCLPPDTCIEHASPTDTVKGYWRETPWYEMANENDEEASAVREGVRRLVEQYGSEPVAMARAGSKTFSTVYRDVVQNRTPPRRSTPAQDTVFYLVVGSLDEAGIYRTLMSLRRRQFARLGITKYALAINGSAKDATDPEFGASAPDVWFTEVSSDSSTPPPRGPWPPAEMPPISDVMVRGTVDAMRRALVGDSTWRYMVRLNASTVVSPQHVTGLVSSLPNHGVFGGHVWTLAPDFGFVSGTAMVISRDVVQHLVSATIQTHVVTSTQTFWADDVRLSVAALPACKNGKFHALNGTMAWVEKEAGPPSSVRVEELRALARDKVFVRVRNDGPMRRAIDEAVWRAVVPELSE